MATGAAGVISCPACGASYPFKPQLAGKKVRCKCGKMFEAKPPKALPAEPVEEPDIFALEADSEVSAIPKKKPTVTRMPVSSGVRTTAGTAATSSPSPAAPDLAAAYPTHGRRRVVAQEEDPGDSKRKLVVPIAVLVMLIGVGIFVMMGMKGMKKRAPMLGDDAKITEMIDDEGGTEVKEWIRSHSRHMIHNMTPSQVEAFADRLYNMGAVKVYAFGEMISASLAVELPADPAQRKALFEFEQEHNGFRSKATDVGQKYFLLYMF